MWLDIEWSLLINCFVQIALRSIPRHIWEFCKLLLSFGIGNSVNKINSFRQVIKTLTWHDGECRRSIQTQLIYFICPCDRLKPDLGKVFAPNCRKFTMMVSLVHAVRTLLVLCISRAVHHVYIVIHNRVRDCLNKSLYQWYPLRVSNGTLVFCSPYFSQIHHLYSPSSVAKYTIFILTPM